MKLFDGSHFIDAEESLLPERIARFGEASCPPAVTETVKNVGAEQAQVLIHAPHTLQVISCPQITTETSTAVPTKSGINSVDLSGQLVNYLLLSPSAAQQALFCAIGGTIEWQLVGAVYFPIADFVVRGDGQTLFVPIPARDNWNISVVAWSNPFIAATDRVRVGYGYIPQGRDRNILE